MRRARRQTRRRLGRAPRAGEPLLLHGTLFSAPPPAASSAPSSRGVRRAASLACARTAVRRDPPFPSTQELRLPFFVAVSAPGSLPGGFNLFFLPLPVPVPSRASRRAWVVRAPRLDSAPTSTSSRTALPPPATGSSSTSSVWSAHVSFLFGVRRVRGRASAGGRCSSPRSTDEVFCGQRAPPRNRGSVSGGGRYVVPWDLS